MPNQILLDLANKLRPKKMRVYYGPGLWHEPVRVIHEDSPEAIEACSWCQAVRELEALS